MQMFLRRYAMQHDVCRVNLIGRGWSTLKINKFKKNKKQETNKHIP